jgi:glycosyltransferase involved in cell wall biosynthesis
MQQYASVTVLVPAAPEAADEEMLEGVHVIRYHYFPVHAWETLCYPGAIVPRIKQKKSRALLVPWLFISLGYHLIKLRRQYDIVHANWLIPQGIIQSFLKTPYVVTGHGGDVTSLNTFPFRPLKYRCIHNATGVVAVSEPLLDVMNAIYENPNSTVIPMGCDTTMFGQQHRIENYFHQDGNKVILFVGRLAEKKGVRYIIEAMQHIKDARLVIAGDGNLRQELEQLAHQILQQNHMDENRIQFIGPKTHEELKTIYASADIFVMPSVTAKDGDKEGFGLVMLEACASGLPVVASRSGGITDLIQDEQNGCLVEERDVKGLADKINELLHNQEKYEKLKTAALDTAKAYDYDIITAKYAAFMKL